MKLNEAFLKVFDEIGEKVITEEGIFNDLIFDYIGSEDKDADWYGESIRSGGVGDEISDETVDNGDHHVEKELILEVADRFFKVAYIGVGKDLDEYVDYSIEEVIPKEVTTTIYTTKK